MSIGFGADDVLVAVGPFIDEIFGMVRGDDVDTMLVLAVDMTSREAVSSELP